MFIAKGNILDGMHTSVNVGWQPEGPGKGVNGQSRGEESGSAPKSIV